MDCVPGFVADDPSSKLLSLVDRAMAICAINTSPHINTSIGCATRCGPGGLFPVCTAFTSVSRLQPSFFHQRDYDSGAEPDLEQSPEQVPVYHPTILIHDPGSPDIPEEDDMDVSREVSDVPVDVLPPTPGFEPFSWLTRVGWGGDPSPFDFSAELPKWFPGGWAGQSRDPPSLPISPILSDTADGRWLQMWAFPEMSRIRRPCLMSWRTLLRDRHNSMCHDQCPSRLPRLSPTFWII